MCNIKCKYLANENITILGILIKVLSLPVRQCAVVREEDQPRGTLINSFRDLIMN